MRKKWMLLTLLLSFQAMAHPVTYEDGTALVSSNSAKTNEFMLAVSFSSWLAGGMFYLRNSGSEFYLPRLNFLVKRWNNENSQTNIYFNAGLGSEKFASKIYTAKFVDASFDWESRKYLVALEHMYVGRDNEDNPLYVSRTFSNTKFRWGFAPYEADFKDLNVWVVGQFDRQSNESQVEFTQFMRFYYHNVYWELGAGFDGTLTFNFMTHI